MRHREVKCITPWPAYPFLGLIKRSYHRWLSMMTSSEGPLFSVASGPLHPKSTTACNPPRRKSGFENKWIMTSIKVSLSFPAGFSEGFAGLFLLQEYCRQFHSLLPLDYLFFRVGRQLLKPSNDNGLTSWATTVTSLAHSKERNLLCCFVLVSFCFCRTSTRESLCCNHRCTGVHIFGDAKNFCSNLIFFFRITYKQQVLMSRLTRTIVNKWRCLHA